MKTTPKLEEILDWQLNATFEAVTTKKLYGKPIKITPALIKKHRAKALKQIQEYVDEQCRLARIEENQLALVEQYLPDCNYKLTEMVVDAQYHRDRIKELNQSSQNNKEGI